ncbi:hypothetical protein XA68_17334 [Ophiocordyceps unilateralis]|uniref:Zn(2)-C6 fungal-type domain-containing protein n=1 Tax=Ophiocordyceps unilateralis TaxID=268505 RepID=A0A2A9P3M8_OPHUN|nr:hypothetical protein XA68_17334 [Ophiocordyceps unilateralis]
MPSDKPLMKVIKSRSLKSRLSQACNRCRSKKIRCDGEQPACSQCASVGIECLTTDKLSRRAFPRCYTDFLEEQLRDLQREVRGLRARSDCVDGPSEKVGHRRRRRLVQLADNGWLYLPKPALLRAPNGSQRLLVGPSSGLFIIAALEQTLQKLGNQFSDFNAEDLLLAQFSAPVTSPGSFQSSYLPLGLFSDRYVDVFFREWAPLFPVLDRITFLQTYDEFISQPDRVRCGYQLAQLHLVFAIAELSSASPNLEQVASYESRWTGVVETQSLADTLDALQCLVLAVLYCTLLGDNRRLQYYKSLAVGLSHRLGLNPGQKRFPVWRTREMVSLTLYTLDCFTAASMGLPRLLRDEAVDDDECVSVEASEPEPAGEKDEMSGALALLQASRLLARVLETLYPATASRMSLQQMSTLGQELDTWYAKLPDHLRLDSVDDEAPTEDIRRPLLALAYHYIRFLIHCPVVGSEAGPMTTTALQVVCECSVQPLDRLREHPSSQGGAASAGGQACGKPGSLGAQGLDLGQAIGLGQAGAHGAIPAHRRRGLLTTAAADDDDDDGDGDDGEHRSAEPEWMQVGPPWIPDLDLDHVRPSNDTSQDPEVSEADWHAMLGSADELDTISHAIYAGGNDDASVLDTAEPWLPVTRRGPRVGGGCGRGET